MTPRSLPTALRAVFQEDIPVVEGTGGLGLPLKGGRLSPAVDTATDHFHKWLASRLIGWARHRFEECFGS